MPRNIETPIRHRHEANLHPEGIPEEEFANKKIRVYTGYHPRTVINIPELKTHITIYKFDSFDLIRKGEINRIVVRREHHKSETAIEFNHFENSGSYQYEAWTADGAIGYAQGENLDLYIASLYLTDKKMNKLIEDAGMDESVREYLDSAVMSAGTHKPTS